MSNEWDTEEGKAKLLEVGGAVCVRDFELAEDRTKPETWIWIMQLPDLDRATWLNTVESAIYVSALMQGARGNHSDLYARTSAAYHDGVRRDLEAGRSEGCEYHSIYSAAWRRASDGVINHQPAPCSCAKTEASA